MDTHKCFKCKQVKDVEVFYTSGICKECGMNYKDYRKLNKSSPDICIYAMADVEFGLIKFGVSKDPALRLQAINRDTDQSFSLVKVSKPVPYYLAMAIESELIEECNKRCLEPFKKDEESSWTEIFHGSLETVEILFDKFKIVEFSDASI